MYIYVWHGDRRYEETCDTTIAAIGDPRGAAANHESVVGYVSDGLVTPAIVSALIGP